MDVLRPPVVWVAGRCYRLNHAHTPTTTINYAEADAYSFEDNMYQDEYQDCTNETDFRVEETNNGKFQTAFPVANPYIPYLIGGKGSTKSRIERETYTTLRFPGKGQDGDVVVTGRDVKTVRQARLKLEMLVEQARKRQPCTHFLSLPTNTPALQDRFIQFKKEVLEKCGDSRGVCESIFLEGVKLHLTLCVMVLADDRERQQAIDVLRQCYDGVLKKLLGGEKLRVAVKGVEYMNDDPAEVDVLYAQATALSWSHNLQAIADSMVAEFVRAGLVTRQQEKVKLHVTLMNSCCRQRSDDSGGDDTARESFCAKKILKEFGEYEFGVVDVEEIHLSIRHTGSATKFYTASAKIPVLPEQAS